MKSDILQHPDQLIYELRCRKCSIITTGTMGDKSSMAKYMWLTAMDDYVKNPRYRKCTNCNVQTVHDLIAFTDIN